MAVIAGFAERARDLAFGRRQVADGRRQAAGIFLGGRVVAWLACGHAGDANRGTIAGLAVQGGVARGDLATRPGSRAGSTRVARAIRSSRAPPRPDIGTLAARLARTWGRRADCAGPGRVWLTRQLTLAGHGWRCAESAGLPFRRVDDSGRVDAEIRGVVAEASRPAHARGGTFAARAWLGGACRALPESAAALTALALTVPSAERTVGAFAAQETGRVDAEAQGSQ